MMFSSAVKSSASWPASWLARFESASGPGVRSSERSQCYRNLDAVTGLPRWPCRSYLELTTSPHRYPLPESSRGPVLALQARGRSRRKLLSAHLRPRPRCATGDVSHERCRPDAAAQKASRPNPKLLVLGDWLGRPCRRLTSRRLPPATKNTKCCKSLN